MLFFLIITSEAYLKSCPTSKMFDKGSGYISVLAVLIRPQTLIKHSN